MFDIGESSTSKILLLLVLAGARNAVVCTQCWDGIAKYICSRNCALRYNITMYKSKRK